MSWRRGRKASFFCFVVRLWRCLSASRRYSVECSDDWWIEEGWKGSCRGVIYEFSRLWCITLRIRIRRFSFRISIVTEVSPGFHRPSRPDSYLGYSMAFSFQIISSVSFICHLSTLCVCIFSLSNLQKYTASHPGRLWPYMKKMSDRRVTQTVWKVCS